MSKTTPAAREPHTIEVKVADVQQLFNSMDPSPFHERDLDHDAEEFIVGWARECPKHRPVRIVVHLSRRPEGGDDPQMLIAQAVQNYFEYRAGVLWRELKQLMKMGRGSLFIGLAFLAACNLAAGLFPAEPQNWHGIAREGFTIMGWVAMWRPLEIYLYRWWPLLELKRLYERLAQAEVEVRVA